jgi:hypothetical protein
MGAAADNFEVVARFHAKGHGTAVDLQNFGNGRDPQADGRRGEMAYIEVGAEALMSFRQEMLDRVERGGLDDVDHDRRGQDRDAAGADKGCGMLAADQKLRGPF